MQIAENVARVRETLARESACWGRAPTLVAVTKSVTPEVALALSDCGVTDVAENRPQAIAERWPVFAPKFRVHMIGRLQTNKVKYIIDKVCMIHSVDRLTLAQEIDRAARARQIVMPVLIEVNMSGEAQKAGVPPDGAESLARACAALPGLRLRGLMTMAPLGATDACAYELFSGLRALAQRLAALNIEGAAFDELSMGMSGDYPAAARAGATLVRVGTALFTDAAAPGA